MSQFVESLKRLYIRDKISKDKLEQLKIENKITEKEFIYIVKGGE